MGGRKLGVWMAAIIGVAVVVYCAAIILTNYGIDLVL
jgi:hypothetical protein